MESKIQIALRHVLNGRRIVERQTTLVDYLRAQGKNTSAAEKLLGQFQRSLDIFEHDYLELMKQC